MGSNQDLESREKNSLIVEYKNENHVEILQPPWDHYDNGSTCSTVSVKSNASTTYGDCQVTIATPYFGIRNESAWFEHSFYWTCHADDVEHASITISYFYDAKTYYKSPPAGTSGVLLYWTYFIENEKQDVILFEKEDGELPKKSWTNDHVIFSIDNVSFMKDNTYEIGVKSIVNSYTGGTIIDPGYGYSSTLMTFQNINDTCVEITWSNRQPDQPNITGPINGEIDTAYSYSVETKDPDCDNVYYKFDWGDGNFSEWLGPYGSGEECEESHSWSAQDTYKIKVKARDKIGAESDWSSPLNVIMPKSKTYLSVLEERFPYLFSLFYDNS